MLVRPENKMTPYVDEFTSETRDKYLGGECDQDEPLDMLTDNLQIHLFWCAVCDGYVGKAQLRHAYAGHRTNGHLTG